MTAPNGGMSGGRGRALRIDQVVLRVVAATCVTVHVVALAELVVESVAQLVPRVDVMAAAVAHVVWRCVATVVRLLAMFHVVALPAVAV